MAKASITLLALLALVVLVDNTQAGAIEGYDREISDDDVREYLGLLENYFQQHEARNKRGRFCLRRDMTCPDLPNGKDVCCNGSQCSCNLFNQNCKCSTIGLFQRLG
ncbi:hypothetical protein TCAL_01914 [Tigriopus californicus]|uniref:Uncharacterized protein n=1 Tax=Tigriopus californicus TaxID=6832 RepID=A0A553P6R9_TIGCA|nr:uncharacterized protein LOC131878245 [Tigriopus californicus]TRY73320.1 hypothetical protein TCAL_01914 [Tigriopus californicus]|eukprot:TCALIF_01914-PA protein Name:"Protein of unknown function" AED:0.00 eAED:0.00 QI:85/1/1/1/0.33/0.5/4/816/106